MMENEIRRLRIDIDELESVYSSMDYESYYLLTDNNTDVPSKDDTGWSTTLPASVKGKYLWVMNVIDTGVSKLKTEPFCTNVGGEEVVTDMDIEFIQTNSRTTAPSQKDTGWSTTAPTHLVGKYIWSRNKITSNYGVKYSDPVCITGDSSVETSQGLLCGTQDGSPLYMHIRYCSLNNPSDISQTSLQPQKYIGYYVDETVTDSTDVSKYSWKTRPDNGLSYTLNNTTYYMHIKYAYDNIGTGLNETGGSFIGYYYDTTTTDSSDVSKYFFFKIESKGILEITEEYSISNDYINAPTSDWSTTKPTITDSKPYLWSRSLIRYTDNSTQAVNTICLSALDGEDVHYIFYRTTTYKTPDTPTKSTVINTGDAKDDDHSQWYEDPQGVTENIMYEWVSKQLRVNGIWSDYSAPSLWAIYGETGLSSYVHIAYSTSADGVDDFTTEKGKLSFTPIYMGTYTSYDPTPPSNAGMYTWTKIKGEDGTTPTEDSIKEVIKNTEINATTLNGNTEDSFVLSNVKTETIYRNDSDTSNNYVNVFKIGNLVICQLMNFSGKGSDYGTIDDYYFRLLPSSKTIPLEYRPQGRAIYINDLNNSDGTSNGRLRLDTNGVIGKMGNSNTSYTQTFGTFIYPLLPLTDTVVTAGTINTLYWGDKVSATVKTTSGAVVKNVPVLFKFVPSQDASNSYEYVGYTNSNGVASVSATTDGNIAYDITIQCKGDNKYNQSDAVTVTSKTVNKTTVTLTATVDGKTISGTVTNQSNTLLSNVTVLLDGKSVAYTDSNGEYSFTTTVGTHTVSVPTSINKGVSEEASKTVTIKNTTTISDQVRVPTTAVNTGVDQYNKAMENINDITKVQVRENTIQKGYAMYTHVNGNGYTLNGTPAPIVFSGFNFVNYGTPSKITITLYYGVFTYQYAITSLNMQIPDVELFAGDTSLGGQLTTNNIPAYDTYYPISFEIQQNRSTDTKISGEVLSSSDLTLKVTPKENNCKTKGTYGVVAFKIDYVEIKAEY